MIENYVWLKRYVEYAEKQLVELICAMKYGTPEDSSVAQMLCENLSINFQYGYFEDDDGNSFVPGDLKQKLRALTLCYENANILADPSERDRGLLYVGLSLESNLPLVYSAIYSDEKGQLYNSFMASELVDALEYAEENQTVSAEDIALVEQAIESAFNLYAQNDMDIKYVRVLLSKMKGLNRTQIAHRYYLSSEEKWSVLKIRERVKRAITRDRDKGKKILSDFVSSQCLSHH